MKTRRVTTVTMMKPSPDPKTKASESHLLSTLPEQHRGGGFLADVFREEGRIRHGFVAALTRACIGCCLSVPCPGRRRCFRARTALRDLSLPSRLRVPWAPSGWDPASAARAPAAAAGGDWSRRRGGAARTGGPRTCAGWRQRRPR